jgi:multiple sugar transport system substrate-binding protein
VLLTDPFLLFWFSFVTAWWTEPLAKAFSASKQGNVHVEIVFVNATQLFPDIVNEAVSQVGLYDGFFTGPAVLGSIVEYNGFADLTSYIQEFSSRISDWSDVMLGYRQNIAQYEGKILLYPLDGDTLSLFYRRDILEAFNLKVPRTWDEYLAVAEATHGKVFENETLVGNCIARMPACAAQYWANMVLATITQTNGDSSGFMFDTADMTPLAGPALEETLRILESQLPFGPPDGKLQC